MTLLPSQALKRAALSIEDTTTAVQEARVALNNKYLPSVSRASLQTRVAFARDKRIRYLNSFHETLDGLADDVYPSEIIDVRLRQQPVLDLHLSASRRACVCLGIWSMVRSP